MEIEFKFQVPAGRFKAVQAAIKRGGGVQRTRLRAHYFDTPDGLLAAHRIALRLRHEGVGWVQTVKAQGGGPLHRLEHNVDLGPVGAGTPPWPDVQRHAGTPVGALLEKVLGKALERSLKKGEAALVETHVTDIWRLTRIEQAGAATVELALDSGEIVAMVQGHGDGHGDQNGEAQRRVATVSELELELIDGGASGDGGIADLATLAQRWSQRHGLWLSSVSKAERGERLRAGLDQVAAVKATAPRFPSAARGARGPSGPQIQRAIVTACLAQVLPNASEIAAGSDDAEQIHQLRIGIRRLRTALRELAPLGAGFDPAWQTPLADAFRALGAQRDRELLLQTLTPRLAEAGAPPVDWPADAVGNMPTPGEVVRAVAFQSALVALIGFAASPSLAGDGDGDTDDAADHLRRRLRKLHARIARDARRFMALTPLEQHSVRKRLKRLRYLAEFAAPLFDKTEVKRYLARLAPAQDALGASNDNAVALQTCRSAADADPRAWFAVGWLSAQQTADARACRNTLRKIDAAPRFWKKSR